VPDVLLLRFRDLTENVNSIEEHNKIAATGGRVLWGWWKKPMEATPDPGLTVIDKELQPGESFAFLIDSATNRLFRAPLFKIYYQPGASPSLAPNPDLCPKYYRETALPAWFQIGTIVEDARGTASLESYVWSKNNRAAPMRSVSALPERCIGTDVLDFEFLDSNVSLWMLTDKGDIGLRGRGSIVPSLSRGRWPARGHVALHLSDPHFGPHHAFRNPLATAKAPRIAKESLVEALIEDLPAAGLGQDDVALLLVTGDLTWAGDTHEFENAITALEELRRKLGLHQSQVIVVPGNHDIEWRHEKGDVDENAELNFKNFCTTWYGVAPTNSFVRAHRFGIAGKHITIIGLNSCRLESKENAGLGFVGREQLAELGHYLKSLADEPGETRVALLHHHLKPVNWVEEIDWATKRVSLTIDAEAVIRTLMAFSIRIALHGHQHQPFFSEDRRIIREYVDTFSGSVRKLDRTLAIVGGGSIGCDRAHLNLIGQNTYNIVDFGHPDSIEIRTRARSSVGPGFTDWQKTCFD